jgi:hypothetical protein
MVPLNHYVPVHGPFRRNIISAPFCAKEDIEALDNSSILSRRYLFGDDDSRSR